MARYTGALCRLCRRAGEKLFLKGNRCYTEKCAIERRKYPPGQHGQRRGKLSDYGIQLMEKQKVRRVYGLAERQFRRYFHNAVKRKGVTGEVLLQSLECRLDNVAHKMGFADNRRQARQFVCHGHFLVNGRPVNIPSYIVKTGDTIELKETSRGIASIQESLAKVEHRGLPVWIELDAARFVGRVQHIPAREEIPLQVQEQMVVEFYSK